MSSPVKGTLGIRKDWPNPDRHRGVDERFNWRQEDPARRDGRQGHRGGRRRLRRASPKTGERRSLRKISAELEKAGYLNERGQPYNPNSIKLMLES